MVGGVSSVHQSVPFVRMVECAMRRVDNAYVDRDGKGEPVKDVGFYLMFVIQFCPLFNFIL